MDKDIRDALNRSTYEVGKHILQFDCEHAVFPVGGDGSVCYCDTDYRAELMAEVLNEFKRIKALELQVSHLTMKLVAADRVMRTVDSLIQRNLMSARSQTGDARLDYGEPFKYEYDKDEDNDKAGT
jgi:hypothetical protein